MFLLSPHGFGCFKPIRLWPSGLLRALPVALGRTRRNRAARTEIEVPACPSSILEGMCVCLIHCLARAVACVRVPGRRCQADLAPQWTCLLRHSVSSCCLLIRLHRKRNHCRRFKVDDAQPAFICFRLTATFVSGWFPLQSRAARDKLRRKSELQSTKDRRELALPV